MPPTLLDKSRPYGQVFGDGAWHYEQDDRRFNAHGREIGTDEPDVEEGEDVEEIIIPTDFLHDEAPKKRKRRVDHLIPRRRASL